MIPLQYELRTTEEQIQLVHGKEEDLNRAPPLSCLQLVFNTRYSVVTRFTYSLQSANVKHRFMTYLFVINGWKSIRGTVSCSRKN